MQQRDFLEEYGDTKYIARFFLFIFFKHFFLNAIFGFPPFTKTALELCLLWNKTKQFL